MPTFKFSKLVRDEVVDHQIASGAKPSFRQLNAAEHKQALIDKIIEEAQEILQSTPEELAGEIADVQQAVDDLREICSLTSEDIARAQDLKNAKKGPFKRGLFIDYVEVSEDDQWLDYFRKNADRYPEIK